MTRRPSTMPVHDPARCPRCKALADRVGRALALMDKADGIEPEPVDRSALQRRLGCRLGRQHRGCS